MMKKTFDIANWTIVLLTLQLIVAIVATVTDIIFFKIGVAGIGILILAVAYIKANLKFNTMWLILLAFLFSMIGDCFLSNMGNNNILFMIGIGLYLLAHLGYLFYSVYNGSIRWGITFGILGLFLCFYYYVLYPHFSDTILASIVLFYLVVSCVSLGAALGIKAKYYIKWPFVAGVALILFSDTIISFKEFVKEDAYNFLILPTYYLAQIGITISVYLKSLEKSSKDQI